MLGIGSMCPSPGLGRDPRPSNGALAMIQLTDSHQDARAQAPPPLPPGIEGRLSGFRSAMRRTKLTEAAATAAAVLVVSFLAVLAIDRLVDTSSIARAALLFGALGFAAIAVPRALRRWYFRHRDLRDVAAEVSLRDARVGDRLMGVFELTRDPEEFRRSPELVRAAVAQGERDLAGHDLAPALPPSRHRRALALFAVPALAAAGIAVAYPTLTANALQRWALPFGDAERYTFARLDGLAEQWVVPLQEERAVTLRLAADTRTRPDEARLELAGEPVLAALDGGTYRLELPPMASDTRALLVVGDLRETIELQPRERPEIVAAEASIDLPDYLGIDAPRRADARGGSVTAVEGAGATVTLTASRPLRSAAATAAPLAHPLALEEPVPGPWAAAIDGDAVHLAAVDLGPGAEHPEGGQWSVHFTGELGLEGHAPYNLSLRARPDEAPSVTLSGIAREVVALETKALTFDVLASDDFGVRQVGLEWRAVGRRGKVAEEPMGSKVLAPGGPEDERLTSLATFKPDDLGVGAGLIELRAWAIDSLPGRGRAYSSPVRVRVMTAAEHMEWVTANLDRWLRRAAEVRDREMQLLSENRELHAMTAADLATDEARRRIEDQSRAERSNRARLQGLVAKGQELLAEAARNDEFGSNALDDWAEANAKLKTIADKRMDTVADLLAKAARSAELPTGDPGSPQAPGQGMSSSSGGTPPPDGGGDPSDPSDSKMASAGTPPPPSPSGESKKKDPKMVGQDRGNSAGQGQAPAEQEERPEDAIPDAPTIMDGESSLAQGEAPEQEPGEARPGQSPPPSSLGLAETTLAPVASAGDGDEQEQPEDDADEVPSMTREEIAAAIAEQEALLAEFDEVAGDIEQTLVNLENSTFVKRLKAASRAQMESAKELTRSVQSGFGSVVAATVDDEVIGAAQAAGAVRTRELPKLASLHGDLDAYVGRLKARSSGDAPKFQRVLEEWNELRPTILADTLVDDAEEGRPGFARASAELLGDTFDRWGEELVGPG